MKTGHVTIRIWQKLVHLSASETVDRSHVYTDNDTDLIIQNRQHTLVISKTHKNIICLEQRTEANLLLWKSYFEYTFTVSQIYFHPMV